MNLLEKITHASLPKNHYPPFKAGDVVKVHCKIVEGEKERIQVFEGVVIARHRNGISTTFTVRKVAYGVGVERIFPLHAPTIDKIEVVTAGRVRRAKLYYLRDLSGKKARITEEQRKLLVSEPTPAETAASAVETSTAAPSPEEKK